MQVAENKKITVIFRIEPGCLGPQGNSHVEKFCEQAKRVFMQRNTAFANWMIVPRYDKNLPELDYMLAQRPLSREHAARLLDFFGQDIEQFEMEAVDLLPEMIDQYFGR